MFSIPVYQPSLKGNEKKYVSDCLDSTWISSKGEFIQKFEHAFAQFTRIPYVTSVTNGTVALHLALYALGIKEGDEVILPTLTYVACANVIKLLGAVPVFVDSLQDSWQMDPIQVEKAISPKTKAIMAVHLYGHPCEIDTLARIAHRHGLYLIEDCAEAFGSQYNNTHVGLFGDIATFSFFGNKTITTGEGGMVVSKHAKIIEKCRKLKSQGLASNREYWHDEVAFNYRMTNICAAIGLAQMERVSEILKNKKRIAQWYIDELQTSPIRFHLSIGDIQHSFWMCSILLNPGIDRDSVRNQLASDGIETRPLFHPLHKLPVFCNNREYFPIAEDLSLRGINLPSGPDLSREEVSYIVGCLKKAIEQCAIAELQYS